jgi:RNA polymerase sigma factor (sigma-70 family)
MPPVPEQLSKTIETLCRSESGRILATLRRLLGDLDLAGEAMHEAFAAALQSWPLTGIPDQPRPWRISTARFKAIDRLRRRAQFDASQKDFALRMAAHLDKARLDDQEIDDDRLRLTFTCCHPALPAERQIALALREICGLTTEEIARSFLVPPATLAQRIVRAKAVIRDQAIPYRVPVIARIILSGSSTLTSPLLELGLADEVLLVVYPVLLGTGKRFFVERIPPRAFELVSTKALASGVILSTYKLNGPLRTGTIGG